MPGGDYLRLHARCEEAGWTVGLSVTEGTYGGVHEFHRLIVRDRAGLPVAQKNISGDLERAARMVLRKLAKL
jgi:hypothetical protein